MLRKLVRSVLYVPAINSKAVSKARTLDVDYVILDLEDAVAPNSKEAARALLAEHLRGQWGHRHVAVRVNGVGTPWNCDDLACVSTLPVAAVVIPKVEDSRHIKDVEAALCRHGQQPALPLWAMIETPLGVLRAATIAEECSARTLCTGPRLTTFVAGTSDLTAALKAKHAGGRQPLLTALSTIVLAARAYGLEALDGVCLQLPASSASPTIDAATSAFLAECRQGRELGFDGKTLIHPTQIAGANAAFGPSPDDIALASRVVSAYEGALARGEGVVLVDGRLIEAMHVAEARQTLLVAQALAARGSES